MARWWTGLCLAAALLLGSAASASDAAHNRHWELVAAANVIVAGDLRVPADSLQQEQQSDGETIELVLSSIHLLKGTFSDGTSAWIKYFVSRDQSLGPSPDTVSSLDGRRVVAFLVVANSALFFANYSTDALVLASPGELDALRKEIARQRSIIGSWRADEADPFAARVREIISSIRDATSQRAAFAALEALGPAAVPAIVDQMDDRRPLPVSAISLTNKAKDAFEGMRHYGPHLYVDAFAAVLNQLTGARFGFIYNGGTDLERQQCVEGWRVYAWMVRNGQADRSKE